MLENWILRPPSSRPAAQSHAPYYGRKHCLVFFLFLCVFVECSGVATTVEGVEQEQSR